MARPYSLAHLTVLGCPPPEVIHIAARCGYDYVSIRNIPLRIPGEPLYVFSEDPALFRATKEAIRDTGVRVLEVENAVIRVDRDVGDYRQALEEAAELGARHVLSNSWSGTRTFIEDQFGKLCDLAAPLGLTVQCEFVTFSEVIDLADAWSVVQACGRPNAGVLIDTLHFERSKVAVEEIERIPKERFHYIQICDAPFAEAPTADDMRRVARGERLYVGEGVAPIRAVVERLPGIPLAIEITHAKRIEALGYERFALECLKTAKAHLAEA